MALRLLKEEAAPAPRPVIEEPSVGFPPLAGSITTFKGALKGRTVVVLGAGGLDYMKPSALRGLPIIAVNSSARVWGIKPKYIVVKEHVEEAIPNSEAFPGVPIVCSAGPYGNEARPTPPAIPSLYMYEHNTNRAGEFDVYRDWPADPDQLVVSMSTITTAMHFACYAGASVILIAGLIPGLLEGRTHMKGYGTPQGPDQPPWMPAWLEQSSRQALAVRRELERRYNVSFLGLFPWITPELDGLSYVSSSVRVNTW